MSQKILKNLEELAASIEQNAPEVEHKIAAQVGETPDAAVVISASKYHSALERLAQE